MRPVLSDIRPMLVECTGKSHKGFRHLLGEGANGWALQTRGPHDKMTLTSLFGH